MLTIKKTIRAFCAPLCHCIWVLREYCRIFMTSSWNSGLWKSLMTWCNVICKGWVCNHYARSSQYFHGLAVLSCLNRRLVFWEPASSKMFYSSSSDARLRPFAQPKPGSRTFFLSLFDSWQTVRVNLWRFVTFGPSLHEGMYENRSARWFLFTVTRVWATAFVKNGL